jgi:hypothetical protein
VLAFDGAVAFDNLATVVLTERWPPALDGLWETDRAMAHAVVDGREIGLNGCGG